MGCALGNSAVATTIAHMLPPARYLDADEGGCEASGRLAGMFHQRGGSRLEGAATGDGIFSESAVGGNSWVRTRAALLTCQPADGTPMIFMLTDGAAYTKHWWLRHEATLAWSISPTTRPYKCVRRTAQLEMNWPCMLGIQEKAIVHA